MHIGRHSLSYSYNSVGLKKRQIRDDIIDLYINDNGCYEERKKKTTKI